MSTLTDPNSIPSQSTYILPSGGTTSREAVVADADYKIERLFLEFSRVAAALGIPGALNNQDERGAIERGLTIEEMEMLLQGDRLASIENKPASSPGSHYCKIVTHVLKL